MTGAALQQETYLPEADAQVARIYDFLEAHEKAGRGAPEPRYFLAGAAPGDQVELPPEVYRAVRQVVEALRQGLAVTVVPQTQTLTTQQAADLLGLTRPTVIKLLDNGKIPFERSGTHRRILLRDLLTYRQQRRAEQYAAIDATATGPGEEEDLETTLRELRQARRTIGARRRAAAD